jgi:hypothetical protein
MRRNLGGATPASAEFLRDGSRRFVHTRRARTIRLMKWKIEMKTSSGRVDRLQAWVNNRVKIDVASTKAEATVAPRYKPVSLDFRAEGAPGSKVSVKVTDAVTAESVLSTSYTITAGGAFDRGRTIA